MRRFRVGCARIRGACGALRIAVPIAGWSGVVLDRGGVRCFNPWRMLVNLPIEMGNLVVSGTKITMEAPRMAGFTPDGRAYEVSATGRGAGHHQAGSGRAAADSSEARDAG